MRALILYRRGPAWDPLLPLGEQAGVGRHIAYQVDRVTEGSFEHSGPFHQAGELVEDLVGLALLARGDLDEAQRWADADPAVQQGLLHAEVLPWHVD